MKKRLLSMLLVLCMVVTMLPVLAMAAAEPVTLTLENPSAVVTVKTGAAGRVPIKVTAPADGYIILTADYDVEKGIYPAFYAQSGEKLATSPNAVYKIPAGETVTVYAGTDQDWARAYEVRVTYHYIPNFLSL